MAITVSINGSSYSIPTQGETKWGTAVTALLQALSTGLLQKAGGSFPLTAEVDFGSNFGTAQLYIKSKASNPGTAGFLRLATGDVIAWRNYDNSADVNFGYLRNTTFNYDAPEFGSKELINVDSNQFLRNKIFGDADTTPIDDNAVFEVRSTVKGVIPFPKMNTTQRDAIATPPNGLWIYNTTNDLPEFFNGTAWVSPGVLSNTPAWNETDVSPSAASANTRFMRKDGGTETVSGDKSFEGNIRNTFTSVQTFTSAGNETLDCSVKSKFLKTGGTATVTLSNMAEGQTIKIYISSTGSSYTITWAGETFKWVNSTIPTPTNTALKFDCYFLEKIGGVVYASRSGVYG